MSVTLMSRVWETALPIAQKVVLLSLADNANDQGRSCFPSVKLISEKCTITPRAVQKNLSLLQEAGIITRKIRINVVSEYVLNVKLITEMAAIEESRRDKEREQTEWRIANSRKNFSAETVDNLAVACGEQYSPHREKDTESGSNTLNDACGEYSSPPPEPRSPVVSNCSPLLSFCSPITTIEPPINHHNNLAEISPPNSGSGLPCGCGGDSEIATNQKTSTDLIWPICSTEERSALTGILANLPQPQHQILLDELEGARQAGTIRKNLVLFAGALMRAMHNGTFTVGYSPVVAAKRREQSQRSTSIESLRTFRPEIAADAAAEGRRFMEKIRSASRLNQKT